MHGSLEGDGGHLGAAINEPFKYARVRLGTTVRIQIHGVDRKRAEFAALAAFARIEALDRVLSDYHPDSEAGQLKDLPAGQPVVVSADLLEMLIRSREISSRTGGAFDITSGSLTVLWRGAFASGTLPEEQDVAAAASRVGWSFMHIDAARSTVALDLPGMQLDFGAIGKGWIADEALSVLAANGCPSSLVEIGGDLAIGDPPPGRSGWSVGVALGARAPEHSVLLSNCGVATSGDAEQFLEVGSTRYSHLLDPRTGWPLTMHRAVSIVAEDAASADALATAVCVLGPVAGPDLLVRWPRARILAANLQ
ncbi:MAG: FAD:protein FMN transferase [Phycisphaerales bacterium]|nr:FAD:protein FMN transferase [Phycisphaerales bacterium]